MVLKDETVEHVLRRTSGLRVTVQISGLYTVAQLGTSPSAWPELGTLTVRLLDQHAHDLTPASLGKLVTGTALVPDARARLALYDLLPELPGPLRRRLRNALGEAHDPSVIDQLLPAAGRDDRVAAHAVATYPDQVLRPYLAKLRALAAGVSDLDCRLWLDVGLARQGEADPLLELLGEITPDAVPRSLYGPLREVEGHFRQVGQLPAPVARRLAAYALDDLHPSLGRRVAALLAGEAMPRPEPAAPESLAAATDLAEELVALRPDDLWGCRRLSRRIDQLRDLPAVKVPGLLDATVGLAFSSQPEVRWLARRCADLATRPEVVARDDLPVVGGALPGYRKALLQNRKGFVQPVVEHAVLVGPTDDVMDRAVSYALAEPRPEVQAELFDVVRGSTAATPAALAGWSGPSPTWYGGGPGGPGGPGEPGGPGAPGGPAEPPGPPAESAEMPGNLVYPRLEAPDSVPPESNFILAVGLLPAPDAKVEATGFKRRVSADVHELDILLKPGPFRLLDPEREHIHLVLTKDDPTPSETLTLAAPAAEALAGSEGFGVILADYYLDQQPLGTATRRVLVGHEPAGDLDGLAETPPLPVGTGADEQLLDLTVTVHKLGGDHVWTAVGPYTGVLSGDSELRRNADEAARPIEKIREALDQWATQGISTDTLQSRLRGNLGFVRDAVPDKIWSAIGAAAQAAQKKEKQPPRIVLRSDDANLPWEAAWLGTEELVEAPDGARNAPYFGAQAVVGRFDEAAGSLAAPGPLTARTVGVLTPRYELVRDLEELEAAAGEAAKVRELFEGAEVEVWPDELDQVVERLTHGPFPDVLHVAAHGRFQAAGGHGAGGLDGLPLLGRRESGGLYQVAYLEESDVRGIGTPTRPGLGGRTLVFLNVCFAAAGPTVLGRAVSLADTFAAAGAFGVIAPLWQVEDERAATYAGELYELARTVPLAEAVRLLRNRSGEEQVDANLLAYRFFGHPWARLHDPGAEPG